MANNITLNFTADTGGLDEASQKLEALKDREQELLDKIKQLKAEQNAATLYAKNAQEQAKATKEYGDKINEVREQVNQTKKSIDDLSEAQKDVSKTLPAEAVNQSFRTMLRNIREQIAYMELMGQTGTEEYQRLVEEAANLVDIQGDVNRQLNNMASDTQGFDMALEGMELVAGGFSVAQGAAALFGAESEDVEKIMVKLQSAIAITTGLQQVSNTLQRQSSIIQAVLIIQAKARTAAEIASTKSTIAATIAQKAFNLVASANPYVLLAMALVTVVGALYLFSQGADDAEEEQAKLNNTIKETNNQIAKIKTDADFNIAIAEASGASIKELRKLRLEAARTALAVADANADMVFAIRDGAAHARGRATGAGIGLFAGGTRG